MINATKDQVILRETGPALDALARLAAEAAIGALFSAKGMGADPYPEEASKKSAAITRVFAKVLRERVLGAGGPALDQRYFQAILDANLAPYKEGMSAESYQAITGVAEADPLGYKKYMGPVMRSCFSTWLLALQQRGALELPFAFQIPFMLPEGPECRRTEPGMAFYGPLLAFIRAIEPTAAAGALDPAVRGYTRAQLGLLLSYGSKTILALGWREVGDANMADLTCLRSLYLGTAFTGKSSPPPWVLLADALSRKFGDGVGVSKAALVNVVAKPKGDGKRGRRDPRDPEQAKEYSLARSKEKRQIDRAAREDQAKLDASRPLDEVMADLMAARDSSSRFAPESALASRGFERAPGVDFEAARSWMELQSSYLAKIRRESYKPVRIGLGYLNAYLFGYLLEWMRRNPEYAKPFPDTPQKLTGSAFVSRLLLADPNKPSPMTVVEFLSKLHEAKGWSQETLYAQLKHIEGFFDFLERHSDELPGCKGFKQAISVHDYPRVRRSPGTVKGLIPRAAFGFLLAYMESLASFAAGVLEKSLRESLDPEFFLGSGPGCRGGRKAHVLDTIADFDRYGCVPFMRWKGKIIVMRHIPNLLECARLKVKGDDLTPGAPRVIPRPHLIHQLIVALQTGLRSNHIQWLDAAAFDVYAKPGETFTKLWVNTDKSKNSGWTPYVTESVIKTLRAQKRWRDRIDSAGFEQPIFYNNNARSKWGSFLPLFSWSEDGRPHLDNHYAEAWKKIVFGAQAAMIEAGVECPLLVRLAPVGISFDDPEEEAKLKEIGSKAGAYTPLVICSSVTPHSARVSVVSNYITALPADLIGKYITGQTPAVVGHYVKLDPNALNREAQHQGIAAAKGAQERAFKDMISGAPGDFIHADGAGSRLARSMGQSVEQTILAYGCLSVGGSDGAAMGVDVLRETIGRNAAFNKTEICPHGNHCPPEIIQELKGAHRCGLCPRAVRSIDHLPAVMARCKQGYEELAAIGGVMDQTVASMSDSDAESVEVQRQQLSEELVGWLVAQEVLESARVRCAAEAGANRWIVQTPEILERELQRVIVPTDATRYALSRLAECQAYPNLQSPAIRAQFDILRRQLAARLGDFKTAFDLNLPANPAAECAGMLRGFVEAHQLSFEQVVSLLQTNDHLSMLGGESPKLIALNPGESS